MSVTSELDEWIAEYGSARDALNVALAKLRLAESRIATLKKRTSCQFGDCPDHYGDPKAWCDDCKEARRSNTES